MLKHFARSFSPMRLTPRDGSETDVTMHLLILVGIMILTACRLTLVLS